MYGSGTVHASRVSPDGQLLDTSLILLTSANSTQQDPLVIWDGNEFWVIWLDSGYYMRADGPEIIGSRVLIDSNGATVPAQDYQRPVDIGGGESGVVQGFWNGDRMIIWQSTLFYSLTPSGTSANISTPGYITSVDPLALACATQSSCMLLQTQEGAEGDVYMHELTLTGNAFTYTTTTQQGAPMPNGYGSGRQDQPQLVAVSSDTYLAVWRDHRDDGSPARIRAMHLSTTANSTPIDLVDDNGVVGPWVGFDGTDVIATWSIGTAAPYAQYLRRLHDPAGSVTLGPMHSLGWGGDARTITAGQGAQSIVVW
jgi:hypothetical protein